MLTLQRPWPACGRCCIKSVSKCPSAVTYNTTFTYMQR